MANKPTYEELEQRVRDLEKEAAERARNQEALLASKERFQAMVETTSDWIWEVDTNGIYTYSNPRVRDILGYEPGEVLGKTPFDFMPLDEAMRISALFSEILEARRPFEKLENMNLHRDGRLVLLETSGVPVFDASGNLLGYRGIDRDITERKKLESALAHKAGSFAMIARNMPVIIYRYDGNGVFTESFGKGLERMGLADDEMVGHNAIEEFPESAEQIKQALRGESIREIRYETRDGKEWWFMNFLGFDSLSGSGAIGFAMDITEQKLAEQRLRNSEEKFSKAFHSSPNLMAITSLSEGRYLDVNDAFSRITGYPREEILGRTSQELDLFVDHRDRDLLARLLVEQGSLYDVEVKIKTSSGRTRTGLFSAEIIEVMGEKCVLSTMDDITERQSLEDQLRQAQKMEAIGRLAGGVAHDFNNLLTAISGYSDLLLMTLNEKDPIRHNIQEIRKAGQRAASLTRQLLAFSRKQVLQPKVLDLNASIVSMDKMLQRLIGEDIELSTELQSGLRLVKVDPGQIEQVIMNLAVNSRDAMPRGGRLAIKTANVDLQDEYARQHKHINPGPYVLLAVSDTGCGMDEETKNQIFEPFFTTKEKEKGTGLGLSTVYGIVAQSGGHIWVSSEPGWGTTFKIYLPQAEEEAETTRSEVMPAAGQEGSETILVVEDDESVRSLIRDILETRGYTILEARLGEQALAICQQHISAIDLMITDVVMPQMSGRELSEHLGRLRPETKVLYVSGHTDDAIAHHGALDPDIAFLQKPFYPEALLQKVREVLGSSKEEETTSSRS